MEKKIVLTINRHELVISNPEKELFPADHITKLDLCTYYQKIAPHLLFYAKGHPLTMHRYPHGIDQEAFFQKDAADYFPDWIDLFISKSKEGKSVHYVVANHTETLVYLANLACITPHLWLSTQDKPHYPDRLIFDLDPAGKADFKLVKWVASQIKKLLNYVDIDPFLMLTGSRGVHIVIPIKQVHTNEQVRAFALTIARVMAYQFPEQCTLEMRIANRGNKIFIDTLRNSFGQTAVAPYAVRARPGAPIATPISWQELSRITTSKKYTLRTIFRRLARGNDPWEMFHQSRITLRTPLKIISKIWNKLDLERVPNRLHVR